MISKMGENLRSRKRSMISCMFALMFSPVFSYMTSLLENSPEGTRLDFEEGTNFVEDLDKVNVLQVRVLMIG